MYESISRVFFGHEHLLKMFFEEHRPKIKMTAEKMIDKHFYGPADELVLIKTALDIWSGSGNARVWELIEVLDRNNFYFVLEALVISKRNRSLEN